MPLFLIGYMYSGKTTVGRLLAARLGLSFYDLDIAIEEKYHTSIPILFDRYGEMAFRKIEQQMLHSLGQKEAAVIATGGGTPCFFDNMDYILAHGHSIYLKLSVDEILQREASSRKRRPLLAGMSHEEMKEKISSQLSLRESYYQKASLTFPAFDPDIDYMIEEINKIISEKQ